MRRRSAQLIPARSRCVLASAITRALSRCHVRRTLIPVRPSERSSSARRRAIAAASHTQSVLTRCTSRTSGTTLQQWNERVDGYRRTSRPRRGGASVTRASTGSTMVANAATQTIAAAMHETCEATSIPRQRGEWLARIEPVAISRIHHDSCGSRFPSTLSNLPHVTTPLVQRKSRFSSRSTVDAGVGDQAPNRELMPGVFVQKPRGQAHGRSDKCRNAFATLPMPLHIICISVVVVRSRQVEIKE